MTPSFKTTDFKNVLRIQLGEDYVRSLDYYRQEEYPIHAVRNVTIIQFKI